MIERKQFKTRLSQYYEDDILTMDLTNDIRMIIDRMVNTKKYSIYEGLIKEEMIENAFEKCMNQLCKRKFKIESDYNPVGYFSIITSGAFTTVIYRHQKLEQLIC